MELLLINSMFLYYIPRHGSFTAQKPCIAGTCPSHKKLPSCKVILSMFSLILKRMLLSVKVPQLCSLVLCFQYHKTHRVSNCYKAILHFSHTCSTLPLQGALYAVNFSETVSDDISNTEDIFLISLVL